jgi:hypothetical protein
MWNLGELKGVLLCECVLWHSTKWLRYELLMLRNALSQSKSHQLNPSRFGDGANVLFRRIETVVYDWIFFLQHFCIWFPSMGKRDRLFIHGYSGHFTDPSHLSLEPFPESWFPGLSDGHCCFMIHNSGIHGFWQCRSEDESQEPFQNEPYTNNYFLGSEGLLADWTRPRPGHGFF